MYYIIQDGLIKTYADSLVKLLGYFYFEISDKGIVTFNNIQDTISYGSTYSSEEAKKDFVTGRFQKLLKQHGYKLLKEI